MNESGDCLLLPTNTLLTGTIVTENDSMSSSESEAANAIALQREISREKGK